MKGKILVVILLIGIQSLSSFSQLSIKDQKITRDLIEIYADNPDNFPYTILINYNLTNCKLKNNSNKKILIPANVSGFSINEIEFNKKGEGGYSFNFKYWPGNQLDASHEDDYLYGYPCIESAKVIQGYHGSYSHKNAKALDFQLPIGSKIYAARDGVILSLKEDSNVNCKSPSCMKAANFLLILHADGSIANYAHLKQNGVLPKVGDTVIKGDLIGYSGNTGWSGTPHLHFEVYTEKEGVKNSQETQFINSNGKVIKGKNIK